MATTTASNSFPQEGPPQPPPIAAAADTRGGMSKGNGPELFNNDEFDEAPSQTDEITALLGSVLVHLIAILLLALAPWTPMREDEPVVIVSSPPEYEQPLELVEEISYSDVPQSEIGANSFDELEETAEASADAFAEVAEIPNPIELEPTELGQILLNELFVEAVAPLGSDRKSKGASGPGHQGCAGSRRSHHL